MGSTPKSSLGRRRGTRNKKSAMRHYQIIAILVCMALVLTMVLVVLASFAFPSDDPSLRHKVEAVPNLLRGGPNGGLSQLKKKYKEHQAAKMAGKDHALMDDHGHAIDKSQALNMALGNAEYPYPLEVVPESYDVSASFKVKGGKRFSEYAEGKPPAYTITEALRQRSDDVARSRRYHVKETFKFAWKNYVEYAFGMDELKPQSASGGNNWGGQGITLVDSLDTLWLMGLKDEFWQGRDWVRDNLDHSKVGTVSVFETTIRDLGGLLAAYDWSEDQVFLTKAKDLAERLLRSFDNTPTGIPYGQVGLANAATSNLGWAGGHALVAEFGTLQVENRYLSKAIGDSKFADKVERVYEILNEISRPDGLYPYYVRNNPTSSAEKNTFLKDGKTVKPTFANDKLTFGAMADSLYEYFLKTWLQGGKVEPMYRQMYDKSMQGMHDELLQRSTPSGLAYIADKNANSNMIDHKMDHLVCFMSGLLALGAYTDPLGLDSTRAQRDMTTARALGYTCYQMYARMNTGISPEYIQFHENEDFKIGRGAPHYLLRPEAVESFFVLNQLTGDPVYREWGWEVYQAIEKYCRTPYGYGALSNVNDVNGKPRDSMESFFLAETLKYLYLLQDPDTEVDILHKHVFNTEAHPLRIYPLMPAAVKV